MIIDIVCFNKDTGGIGNKGQLLYDLKRDLAHFSKQTRFSSVVLGRKTYESIGKFLPNRYNIIVSSSLNINETNAKSVKSLDEAIKLHNRLIHSKFMFDNKNLLDKLFICGGEKLYNESKPDCIIATCVDEMTTREFDTIYPLDKLNDYILASFLEFEEVDGLTGYPCLITIKTLVRK